MFSGAETRIQLAEYERRNEEAFMRDKFYSLPIDDISQVARPSDLIQLGDAVVSRGFVLRRNAPGTIRRTWQEVAGFELECL